MDDAREAHDGLAGWLDILPIFASVGPDILHPNLLPYFYHHSASQLGVVHSCFNSAPILRCSALASLPCLLWPPVTSLACMTRLCRGCLGRLRVKEELGLRLWTDSNVIKELGSRKRADLGMGKDAGREHI